MLWLFYSIRKIAGKQLGGLKPDPSPIWRERDLCLALECYRINHQYDHYLIKITVFHISNENRNHFDIIFTTPIN